MKIRSNNKLSKGAYLMGVFLLIFNALMFLDHRVIQIFHFDPIDLPNFMVNSIFSFLDIIGHALLYSFILLMSIWTLRAYLNFEKLINQTSLLGRVNAAVSWVIPIANAFMPYYFMNRIWKQYGYALDSVIDRSQLNKLLNLILAWEIMAIAKLVLSLGIFIRFFSTTLNFNFFPYITIVSDVLYIAMGVVAILTVPRLNGMEQILYQYRDKLSNDGFRSELDEFGSQNQESDFEK